MSSYSHYRGRSTGRIVHFLHYYCYYHVAEHATIGNDKVYWGDRVLADITWSTHFGEKDVPEFLFYGKDAETYHANQVERRTEAIEESVKYKCSDPDYMEEVSHRIVQALNPIGYRSANLWASICEDIKPKFFLGKTLVNYMTSDNLYFDIKKRRYVWNRELNDWLLDEIF